MKATTGRTETRRRLEKRVKMFYGIEQEGCRKDSSTLTNGGLGMWNGICGWSNL
jgi:hypothetical protein